jgi:hypothetical protein
MLILIHNIHSGLNLNSLNVMEQYYQLNNYFINDNNFLTGVEIDPPYYLDPKNFKDVY